MPRCNAKTNAGTQCTRTSQAGKEYCFQHYDYGNPLRLQFQPITPAKRREHASHGLCAGVTKQGALCRRKTARGYCNDHEGQRPGHNYYARQHEEELAERVRRQAQEAERRNRAEAEEELRERIASQRSDLESLAAELRELKRVMEEREQRRAREAEAEQREREAQARARAQAQEEAEETRKREEEERKNAEAERERLQRVREAFREQRAAEAERRRRAQREAEEEAATARARAQQREQEEQRAREAAATAKAERQRRAREAAEAEAARARQQQQQQAREEEERRTYERQQREQADRIRRERAHQAREWVRAQFQQGPPLTREQRRERYLKAQIEARNALPLPRTLWTNNMIIQRYVSQGASFDSTSSSSPLLSFTSIPWPVAKHPQNITIDDITWESIEAFFRIARLLRPRGEVEQMIRDTKRRFHPDRWVSRGRYERLEGGEDEREFVKECVMIVSQAVNPM